MAVMRPITGKEVVVGRSYIEVVVCMDGGFFLKRHILLERPAVKKGRLLIRVGKKKPGMSEEEDCSANFQSATDLGLNPQDLSNHHRLFRDTKKNREVLERLEREQAIEEYLARIGVENPRETAARLRTQGVVDFTSHMLISGL